MDQLRADLNGSRSVLILDLKGLDAIAEHQFRRDLRKKSIRVRALKNSLARRVFSELGMGGLSTYLEGPSVLVWGGDGVAELAKEVSTQVKNLKKPEIKGGAVDGVVIAPSQVEDITKLPSREQLIGRVTAPGAGAGAANCGPRQRARGQSDGPAKNDVRSGRRRGSAGRAGSRGWGLKIMSQTASTMSHSRQGASDACPGSFLIFSVPPRLTNAPRMIMI